MNDFNINLLDYSSSSLIENFLNLMIFHNFYPVITGAFDEWLQRRDRVTYDRYRSQRVAVKLAVQAAKRMADCRLGERLGNDFDGNIKMFWKEVKRVRKGQQPREEMVKDVSGQILRNGVEVRRRWAQYFEQVLITAQIPITEEQK